MLFRIALKNATARRVACERYGAKFTLPGRGPTGANRLASRLDFKTPVAVCEEKETACRVRIKWCGQFHVSDIGYSPLDVLAWCGDHAPYKYDLRTFAAVASITFDHPDASIFTVLSAPTAEEGTANIDFLILPGRWPPQKDTFRPPRSPKNIMSEPMGNICGVHDAKPQGFVPGGISLHNCMLPHGPDRTAFEKATTDRCDPVKLTETMSFRFEIRFPQRLTAFAATEAALQDDCADCRAGPEKKFDGTPGLK